MPTPVIGNGERLACLGLTFSLTFFFLQKQTFSQPCTVGGENMRIESANGAFPQQT